MTLLKLNKTVFLSVIGAKYYGLLKSCVPENTMEKKNIQRLSRYSEGTCFSKAFDHCRKVLVFFKRNQNEDEKVEPLVKRFLFTIHAVKKHACGVHRGTLYYLTGRKQVSSMLW